MKYLMIFCLLLVGCDDSAYTEKVKEMRASEAAFMDSCQEVHKRFECVTLYLHRYESPCQAQSGGSGISTGIAAGVSGAVVHHLLK